MGYTEGVTHLRHPEVGDLYLTRTKLELPNTGGAHIITWHAPPKQHIGTRTRPVTRIAAKQCLTAENKIYQDAKTSTALRTVWRRDPSSSIVKLR